MACSALQAGRAVVCFTRERVYTLHDRVCDRADEVTLLSLAGAATSINFVATKRLFFRDKSMVVATKLLLRQTYFCPDKTFVATNICRDKNDTCGSSRQ